MTGAMYAAVSGLRSHMSALNVIGNNIANINTNAYKASRYVFNEELYTNVKTGSNGTLTTGGTNPAQIGYGTNVGAVDIDMSTKNYTPTGKPGDVTIDGDGFLLVGPKDLTFENNNDLKNLYLTRLGDLEVRADGYLCDHDGNVVYGWLEVEPENANGGGNNNGADVDPNKQPTVTSRILTPIRVPMLASNGDVVWPTEGDNTVDDPEVGDTVGNGTGGGANNVTVTERAILNSFTINENGQLTGVVDETDKQIVVGYIALGKVDNPNGVTHVDGRLYRAMDGAGDLSVFTMGEFENLPSDAKLDANNNGAGGAGGTTDRKNKYTIGSTKSTNLVPNGLESSGTELATEISNMIMMQRGYQANTRIITVTDSMLEELVNIKR